MYDKYTKNFNQHIDISIITHPSEYKMEKERKMSDDIKKVGLKLACTEIYYRHFSLVCTCSFEKIH